MFRVVDNLPFLSLRGQGQFFRLRGIPQQDSEAELRGHCPSPWPRLPCLNILCMIQKQMRLIFYDVKKADSRHNFYGDGYHDHMLI